MIIVPEHQLLTSISPWTFDNSWGTLHLYADGRETWDVGPERLKRRLGEAHYHWKKYLYVADNAFPRRWPAGIDQFRVPRPTPWL